MNAFQTPVVSWFSWFSPGPTVSVSTARRLPASQARPAACPPRSPGRTGLPSLRSPGAVGAPDQAVSVQPASHPNSPCTLGTWFSRLLLACETSFRLSFLPASLPPSTEPLRGPHHQPSPPAPTITLQIRPRRRHKRHRPSWECRGGPPARTTVTICNRNIICLSMPPPPTPAPTPPSASPSPSVPVSMLRPLRRLPPPIHTAGLPFSRRPGLQTAGAPASTSDPTLPAAAAPATSHPGSPLPPRTVPPWTRRLSPCLSTRRPCQSWPRRATKTRKVSISRPTRKAPAVCDREAHGHLVF